MSVDSDVFVIFPNIFIPNELLIIIFKKCGSNLLFLMLVSVYFHRLISKNISYVKLNQTIDDEHLKLVIRSILCNCNKITSEGVSHLSGLINLQQLNLSNCNKITSEG